MIHTRLDVQSFMRAWSAFEARHVMPVAGGLLDQTAHFVDACSLMDSERADWDDRERERKKRDDEQRQNARARR